VWRSLVSVLDWGSRGREFKSHHSDGISQQPIVDGRLLAFLFAGTRLKKILEPFIGCPLQVSASGLFRIVAGRYVYYRVAINDNCL
jgi:hypothetical protein